MDVGGQLGAPYPRSNANSIWAQGAVALGSILALIPVVTMDRVVAGCMFVLAQVSLYGHLIAITHQGGHPLTTCVAPEVLRKIAYKTVAMTLIGTWVRFYSIPAPKIVVIDVLLAGITKAAGWLLLLQMVRLTCLLHMSNIMMRLDATDTLGYRSDNVYVRYRIFDDFLRLFINSTCACSVGNCGCCSRADNIVYPKNNSSQESPLYLWALFVPSALENKQSSPK